jgi:hypothetical protein
MQPVKNKKVMQLEKYCRFDKAHFLKQGSQTHVNDWIVDSTFTPFLFDFSKALRLKDE